MSKISLFFSGRISLEEIKTASQSERQLYGRSKMMSAQNRICAFLAGFCCDPMAEIMVTLL
jgi:hypothetical protein